MTPSPTMSADAVRTARYSAVAIVLHWTIAMLLFAEVALGLRMEDEHGPARFAVFQLHKSIGITILLLAGARLAWRLYRRPPPVGAHGWEKVAAHVVHGLFYLLLFVLPLSGWIIVSTSRIVVPTLLYGVIPWPHFPGTATLAAAARGVWNGAATFTHVNLVTLLYGLVALHVAGALKHHWFDRDGDLARMAPGIRPRATLDPRLLAIALGAAGALASATWLPTGATLRPATPPPLTAVAPTLPSPATQPAAVTPPNATLQVPPAAPPPATTVAPTNGALPNWKIQPGSTLQWRTTWSGDTIDGGFKRFDGEIAFNPDRLDASHVVIRVDTTSVFSGDPQRDAALTGDDWFATSTEAAATFTATRFRRTAPGHYIASGMLRLKGVSLPLPLAFTLEIIGDVATMRGTTTIDRTRFKIGEGDYAATNDIPAAVSVDVDVTARRQ